MHGEINMKNADLNTTTHTQKMENTNMKNEAPANDNAADRRKALIDFARTLAAIADKRPDKAAKPDAKTLDTQLNAVVRIDMVVTDPNYSLPWQSSSPIQASGSGVVIAGKRILTNAHNVANTTYITVRRQDLDTPFDAEVFAVNHTCDLALLKVKDEAAFFKGITPLELGDTPPVQSEVQVAGYPVGGSGLSITQGIISRIEEVSYAHSGEILLGAQLDAAINPGNSGGPVLRGGKIVGIAFQGLNRRQNIGYMIPPVIIRHFLKDLENGRIEGFGNLPFDLLELNNPDTRRFLKMKPDQTGLLVFKLDNPALKDCFRLNDVLLSVDGLALSNLGTIRQPGRKPRSLLAYYREKQIGEIVEFGVLRDGREIKVQMPVQKTERMVPGRIFDAVPEYYILGSLVFTPLTGNLLDREPTNPFVDFDPYFPNRGLLEGYVEKPAEKPGDQVVLLQKILGDPVTVGYDNDIAMLPVVKVDGRRVRNLRQLVKLVEASKGPAITFTLQNGTPLTLDLQHLREATPRVLRRYRIPADRSPGLESK